MDAEAARSQLSTAVERMVGFIVARPEAGEIVQFVLRELAASDRGARHASMPACSSRRTSACAASGRRRPASRRKRPHQDHRFHPDRPGRLFPHRPRGGDAAHGLERHRAGRGGRGHRCGQGQSRRDPRRPERQRSHELRSAPSRWSPRCLPPARPPPPLAVGYVEGEYVLLAPIEVAAGRDRSGPARRPRRGRARRSPRWKAATPRSPWRRPRQRSRRPRRQLADLKIGKRPEEIAVLEATLVSAKAQKPRRPSACWRGLPTCWSAASPHRPTSTRPQTAVDVGRARGRPGRGQSGGRQAAGPRRKRSRPPRTR